MTVTTPSSSSGHSDRRPSFRSTRSAIAAATRPANPRVIGSRSQTRRGLSGAGVVVRRAETGEQRAEEEHQVGQLLARVDEAAAAVPDEMQPERAADQERQVRHDVEEIGDRPERAAIRERVIRQRLRHRRHQDGGEREAGGERGQQPRRASRASGGHRRRSCRGAADHRLRLEILRFEVTQRGGRRQRLAGGELEQLLRR